MDVLVASQADDQRLALPTDHPPKAYKEPEGVEIRYEDEDWKKIIDETSTFMVEVSKLLPDKPTAANKATTQSSRANKDAATVAEGQE